MGCQDDPMGVPDINASLPEITGITSGVDKMLAGGETDVEVTAKSGESYSWSADAGTFASASSANTTWSSEGIVESIAIKLVCTVSNGSGSRRASVTVQVVVSTTPTFHWPFDNNLTDIIAGNNGTAPLIGFNTDDKIAGAASAEFSDTLSAESVMIVADDPSVRMGPEDFFSMTVWIKTDAEVGRMLGRQTAINVWDDGYDKSFNYEGAGLLYRANGWLAIDGEGPELNDGEWHFLVVNHFGGSDLYELYVDGELIADGELYYGEPTQSDEGTTFYFGGLWGDADFPTYQGLMDEFKYYDVVLTPAEVALLSIIE